MLSALRKKNDQVPEEYAYENKGWYLIDATVPARVEHLEVWAVLSIEASGSVVRIPLGASLKGRVLEVIPRPREKHALTLEACDSGGSVSILSSHISWISIFFAGYRMVLRVQGSLSLLNKCPRNRLRLGWLDFLRDPYKVYRTVGSLRYHYPAPDFEDWRRCYWDFTPQVHQRLIKHTAALEAARKPVSVFVDARQGGNPEYLEQTLKSVRGQLGCVVQLQVLDDAETMDRQLVSDQWVLMMRPGQRLEPWALAWFLDAAARHSDVRVIYSDHIREYQGNISSEFKPDWSLEYHRVTNYTGDLLMVRSAELAAATETLGYPPSAYELMLELGGRLLEHQVCHIPAVLWSEQKTPMAVNTQQLQAYLQRHAAGATLEEDKRGFPRIRYGLTASQPLISIVIPTRDMLHFLQPCVDSILQKTTWHNYEILILDNQSSCPDTLGYMASLSSESRIRILAYNHPFNFSAINNFAVEHAKGELVCMLNNDTEVISPDWLDEMASRLMQPGVGAVGARLYFRDGRVQHAGDVVGVGGCACHLHGILDADDPGYMNRAVLPQELSAVTAACLLTHKQLYQSLGGLDEKNLPVAFNDVDFCLRVREAGFRVVYTPYAELYHYESVSRGKDNSREKLARALRETRYMRRRWPHMMARDPYYNPNLNYGKPDFTLGKVPRIDWPW
jgi:GT2 family glycosyltransferase